MTALQSRPTASRSLGGKFLPPENARRLHVFQYVETALLHAMAGWLPLVPELDRQVSEVDALASWAATRSAELVAGDQAGATRVAAHLRGLERIWERVGDWTAEPAAGEGVSLLAELRQPPEGAHARVTGLARD